MHAPPLIRSLRSYGVVIAGLLLSSPLWADDLTDSESLLCYGWSAARCTDEVACDVMEPYELNLPDFLKIDLQTGIAVTTETAPELRETEIQTVEREDGTIILQGRQSGRAFSWVIEEVTGEGTLTVSTLEAGITVFTVCTPTENL